jgi:hypothetical protein
MDGFYDLLGRQNIDPVREHRTSPVKQLGEVCILHCWNEGNDFRLCFRTGLRGLTLQVEAHWVDAELIRARGAQRGSVPAVLESSMEVPGFLNEISDENEIRE